jgi:acetylornithine deacetylase/succinyl-diaminopimelate desuccinylase family protein
MTREDLVRLVESRRERCTRFLQQAIRIPSISKHEAEMGAFLASTLASAGLDVRVVEAEKGHPNVLASARAPRPGPVLLLNDHMDVVPPGPRDEWEVDPFGGVIRDGWLYGRGAVDSKGGLCAMIMAAEIFVAAGGPERGELFVTAVCDEEVGGQLGTRHLLREGLIRGDFGIVAEPTGNRIEIATKGVLHVEVTTKGRMAHGGRPWLGINAIEHMARVIGRLDVLRPRLAARRHPLVGSPSIFAGIISGGTVPNMVASDCRLVLDRRVIPGESSADALAEIQALLDELTAADPNFRASARPVLDWPSVEVSPDVPVLPALRRAIREVTGTEPGVGGKDGGTDAAWIFKETGIPMVHFSPGESHLVLAANERVNLDAYMHAIAAFVLTFEDVLGVRS